MFFLCLWKQYAYGANAVGTKNNRLTSVERDFASAFGWCDVSVRPCGRTLTNEVFKYSDSKQDCAERTARGELPLRGEKEIVRLPRGGRARAAHPVGGAC